VSSGSASRAAKHEGPGLRRPRLHRSQSVYRALDRLHKKHTIAAIIQGGAKGADRLAVDWATSRGVVPEWYIADWKRLGPGAGPVRNQRMMRRATAAGTPVGIQSRNNPMADTDTKTTDLDAKALLSPPMMPVH
jgi:YspA, cpYpsA-related SLOG family